MKIVFAGLFEWAGSPYSHNDASSGSVSDSPYRRITFRLCNLTSQRGRIGQVGFGVEIVPSHNLLRQMSSGVSYGEQLICDVERIGRTLPSIPVKVILVDP